LVFRVEAASNVVSTKIGEIGPVYLNELSMKTQIPTYDRTSTDILVEEVGVYLFDRHVAGADNLRGWYASNSSSDR
jgi:hypothetical protein